MKINDKVSCSLRGVGVVKAIISGKDSQTIWVTFDNDVSRVSYILSNGVFYDKHKKGAIIEIVGNIHDQGE